MKQFGNQRFFIVILSVFMLTASCFASKMAASPSPNGDEPRALPVIHITTPELYIWNDNLTLAHFSITDPQGESFSAHIGIKCHGGFSLSFPKRSFRIEFWADESGNTTENHALMGMRSDDDWLLLAAYNEPLRARSMTCHDLWREMHTPYYIQQEPNAQSCVNMKYAELYVNGVYAGVYIVAEKVDRKLLKLKPFDGAMHGELYKGKDYGATIFTGVPPCYDNSQPMLDGFEFKYPNTMIDWANLYDFLDFVVNADDNEFFSSIYRRVQIDNLVDYYIFMNATLAVDNYGKNVYVAKYKENEPYFFVPWDLDATMGNWYDGTPNPNYEEMLSNGLYNRLLSDKRPQGFCAKLLQSWNNLYGGLISHDHIMALFLNHVNYLKNNGVYEREREAWPDFTFDTTQITYLSDWLSNRLPWLDNQIRTLTQGVGMPEFTSSCRLYPNPTNGRFTIEGTGTLSITNVLGQVILKKEISENEILELPRGLYFVTLDGQTQKLVVN